MKKAKPNRGERRVKISLSLPASVLTVLDQKARASFCSRSQYNVNVLLDHFQQKDGKK